MPLKAEIGTVELAKALGYEGDNATRNARNWLESSGIACRRPGEKRSAVYTTRELLAEVAPHVLARLLAQTCTDEEIADEALADVVKRAALAMAHE